MATPWIAARGTPEAWQGTYVQYDGDVWSVLPMLEEAFQARGGDLDSVMQRILAPALGWRSFLREAYPADDDDQARWIGRHDPENTGSGLLTTEDSVVRDHVVFWYVIEVAARRLHVVEPDGSVAFHLDIAPDGALVGEVPAAYQRDTTPWIGDLDLHRMCQVSGVDPARTLALLGQFVQREWPGIDFEIDDSEASISIVRWRTVVETVDDPVTQMTLEAARELDIECQLGDAQGRFMDGQVLVDRGLKAWLEEQGGFAKR